MMHGKFSRILPVLLFGMAGSLESVAVPGIKEAVIHSPGQRGMNRKGNYCTDWKQRLNGQTNGKRECARRVRQMSVAFS